jgi:anion-transporting  ArsA/GET3 family ATPase
VQTKLHLVMGKGGVGRTTIAAALALAHARVGSRVALVSLASPTELESVLRTGWGPLPVNLEVVSLDPRRILDDVLGKLMHVPALAGLITSHPAYDAVYRIAPGVKELALLHRLLELRDAGGQDRIVVDAYATGHGTHFLQAPQRSARMLVGVLAQRAQRIDAALRDPARCHVVVATTPEEMPVREALELAAHLRAGGFPLQGIVANRVPPRLFPSPQALPALEVLATRQGAAALASEVGSSWKTVQRLAKAAAHLERSSREAGSMLDALRAQGAPVVTLPLIPEEEGRLRPLAARLEEAGL